jgi:hypothetical protein
MVQLSGQKERRIFFFLITFIVGLYSNLAKASIDDVHFGYITKLTLKTLVFIASRLVCKLCPHYNYRQ